VLIPWALTEHTEDACLEEEPTCRAPLSPAGSQCSSSAGEHGQILVAGMACFAPGFTAFQESVCGEHNRTVRCGLVVDSAVLGLWLDSDLKSLLQLK